MHLSGENFQIRGSAMVLASLLLGLLLLLPAPWRGECHQRSLDGLAANSS